MLNYTTLMKGKHVEVVSPDGYPYEALHERDFIAGIPLIRSGDHFSVLVRQEICPPYLIKDNTGNSHYYTLITGKIEGDSKIVIKKLP